MKKKRFIKKLMAQRVPRNRAVAIAELVRVARVPYKNVNVIGLRPYYEDFTAYIIFDCHLWVSDLKQRLETLSYGTMQELNKVIRKNKELRAKRLSENPWIHNPYSMPTGFYGAFDLNRPMPYDSWWLSAATKAPEFSVSEEGLNYLRFKKNIGNPSNKEPGEAKHELEANTGV